MATRVLRTLLRVKGSSYGPCGIPAVLKCLPVAVNTHRHTGLVVTPSNYTRLLTQSWYQSTSVQLLECTPDGKNFCVTWPDGEQSRYHSMWLRHNCQCPECWDSSSNLKRAAVDKLQGSPVISSAPVLSDSTVNIRWEYGDGGRTHEGHVDLKWLKKNSYSGYALRELKQKTNLSVAHSLPQVDYSEVAQGDYGLWKWLKNLNEFGVCLLTGVPITSGQIGKLAELAGGLMESSQYGKVLDVISSEEQIDLVSSTAELSLHIDNCHLEVPPGLVMLHCLRNDVEGGVSITQDIVPVISELRTNYPQHFSTLTEVPATFHRFRTQSDDPWAYSHRRPHIILDRSGEVIAMYWNPILQGPLLVQEDDVEHYYDAICCLEKLLSDSKFQLSHHLKPGEALTMNNRRVMHGRSLIKLNGGIRHMQGAYVTMDDFNSKVRVVASKCDPQYKVKAVFNGSWF